MADNKKKKGKPDRDRVNLGEDYEVRYRAKALGVPKEKLKAAAKKVGSMVKDVKKALGLKVTKTKAKSSTSRAKGGKTAAKAKPTKGKTAKARK